MTTSNNNTNNYRSNGRSNNNNNNYNSNNYSNGSGGGGGDPFYDHVPSYQNFGGAPMPAVIARHNRNASNTSTLGSSTDETDLETGHSNSNSNTNTNSYSPIRGQQNNQRSTSPMRGGGRGHPQHSAMRGGGGGQQQNNNNSPMRGGSPLRGQQNQHNRSPSAQIRAFQRSMGIYTDPGSGSASTNRTRGSFVTFQNPAENEVHWVRGNNSNSNPRDHPHHLSLEENDREDEEEEEEEEEGETTEEDETSSLHSSDRSTGKKNGELYNWRQFAPKSTAPGAFFRWIVVGGSRFSEPQSDGELHHNLAGLARCLHLLRQYLEHYGMPARGGFQDQNHVLREIIRDLYAGGAPLWALEPVMQKAAEGLTGHSDVNWQIYPRKALIYNPSAGTTTMFKMERGFNIAKMSAMEGVAVRLASFASNANGVSDIPARFPNPQEYKRAQRRGSVRNLYAVPDKKVLARKILNLASKQQGLFYYVNSREYLGSYKYCLPVEDSIQMTQRKRPDYESTKHNGNYNNSSPPAAPPPEHGVEDFWIVSDEERELFSRLACLECLQAISDIDAQHNDPNRETIYTPFLILVCRVTSAAGACAFWFNGGLEDMIVSGMLAVFVAFIGTTSLLNKQERLVYEVVASFFVGLISGTLALKWPDHFCFAAMAISGILDLLQGFRVVYAIIEIMSKHTVAGGADLLEGVLFTGLLAYFLQFGKYVAATISGVPDNVTFGQCTNGISAYWYFFLVPMTTLGWATLFTPIPKEIPVMAFHGTLGYTVNLCLTLAGSTNDVNYFLSASALTFSAGIISRFTGRQAVGNTAAGMYTILPGAYLVSAMGTGKLEASFFTDILFRAIIIGIGGWTGTLLCSPTLLGTTRGLLWQQTKKNELDADRHALQDPPTYMSQSTRHLRQGSILSHSTEGQMRGRHHRHESNDLMEPLVESAPSSGDEGPRFRGSRVELSQRQRYRHNRMESDVSPYDFSQPTSTMLYF